MPAHPHGRRRKDGAASTAYAGRPAYIHHRRRLNVNLAAFYPLSTCPSSSYFASLPLSRT
eukprot:1855672-Pleurochrysis_carterae.AAC.1